MQSCMEPNLFVSGQIDTGADYHKSRLQDNLRWNCEQKTADKICSFNRHYAEVINVMP